MNKYDFVGIGFVSNDHLAVLPFIPMDTRVKMLSHKILGGGPAGNSTAGAAALGMKAAFCGTVGDDADLRNSIRAERRISFKNGHGQFFLLLRQFDQLTAVRVQDDVEIVPFRHISLRVKFDRRQCVIHERRSEIIPDILVFYAL